MENFSFAGFTWPRKVASPPKKGLADRLARFKAEPYHYATYPYYHQPVPNQTGAGFYLEDAGMPGLRWSWCDDVADVDIRHSGSYCDEYGDETIRGLVMRLPRERGFLAGWSMGERMSSAIETDYIYDSERDAAYAAESIAARAAERERDWQRAESARIQIDECHAQSRDAIAEFHSIAVELRTARAHFGPALCGALRDTLARNRRHVRQLMREAREAREIVDLYA